MGQLIGYDELLERVAPESYVNFREYTLQAREQRRLTIQIDALQVVAVLPADYRMNRDEMEVYYGKDLPDTDYLALSHTGQQRLVLQMVDRDHPEYGVMYRVVGLNRYYMSQSLQELELADSPEPVVLPPSQLLSAAAGVKGFNDYQVGAGLLKNIQK